MLEEVRGFIYITHGSFFWVFVCVATVIFVHQLSLALKKGIGQN